MNVALSNLEKAGAILVCLGVEQAAQVLAHLSQEEVSLLATQVAQTRYIPPQVRGEIMSELMERYRAMDTTGASGGLAFVQRMLADSFGEERAMMLLDQLSQTQRTRPFSSLRSIDAGRLLEVLAGEHSSVIALVLYFLPRDKAAQMMAGLDPKMRQQVVTRLANFKPPAAHMVVRLEQLLNQRLAEASDASKEGEGFRDASKATGPRVLVEILRRCEPGVEKNIYDYLSETDPTLAEEVRKTMFMYEDIAQLDRRAIQLVLREVPTQELALSLKTADDTIRNLVFSNVSENSAKVIREELELLGPVRASQVEEAKNKVVATVRRMAEEGVIDMASSLEDQMV